jgi:hypothetical protein
MALSNTYPAGHVVRDRLDRVSAAIGRGFNAVLKARARTGEIERLEAKSDAELAAMGLTRDRIVHHVFRDLLHV